MNYFYGDEDGRIPLAEIFGPTIQGEGRLAGSPCYFIRVGGCDYRCAWCDTPHAVLPHLVKKLERYSQGEILDKFRGIFVGPKWVIISGGNPAIYHLSDLVSALHKGGCKVAVETQGSIWQDWLGEVDLLTVSPKGASAKLTPYQENIKFDRLAKILGRRGSKPTDVKVPIFTDSDYAWLKNIYQAFYPLDGDTNSRRFFASVGTEVKQDTRESLCEKFRELAIKVANDPEMSNVTVLPQLHVLAWGQERGH